MYDFTTAPNRKGTGAFKWEAMQALNPEVEEGVIPLSVADMEFYNAPEITEGLKRYLDRNVLGYTGPTEAYDQSVLSWQKRRHNVTVSREQMVQSDGIVPALYRLVGVFSKPEDSVLVLTPVYYPFFRAIEENGRKVVRSALIPNGRTYEIDFSDFAEKAARKDVTLCILSSPHNPVGKVFSGEEIQKLAEICYENGVFVIADEIHNDLILPGYRHVSFGTLDEPYRNNCVLCTAPSKTFNLAGMKCSNLFLFDPERRKQFADAEGYTSLGALSYEACRLAYDEAEGWLDALLLVLDENKRMVETFLRERLPMLIPYELQGTYLLWVDCRALGLSAAELERFMTKEAQLFLDEGILFGEEGAGFERINIACPKDKLYEALLRLERAVTKLVGKE